MRTGDICGTGTISGPSEGSFGSLLELSWNGSRQVSLSGTDEQRTYLQDGDTVSMTGFCQKGNLTLGFGNCAGKIISNNKNNTE
jgi:fumarylacetoacetase